MFTIMYLRGTYIIVISAGATRIIPPEVIFWCSLLRLVGPFQKKRGEEEKRGGWGADIIKNTVISFQILLLILKTMTILRGV